jgi:hypothetical protein
MKKPVVLALIGLSLAATVFATQAAKRITINGKAVVGEPIVANGETYVPLKALKAAGVASTITNDTLILTLPVPGGSSQVVALEGGVNDWLFNGIWRFRVTGVRANDDGRPGWLIDVELKNGTTADSLALDGTGFESVQLVMDDENIIKQPYNITDFVRPVGQASTIKESLRYYDDEGGDRKPVKLIVRITPDEATKSYLKSVKLGYSVPDPSFRINLKKPE